MKKSILFLFFVFALSLSVSAQLRYPIVGKHNDCHAQGMTIWGDNAYLFNNSGQCRILDLKTGVVTAEFPLGSADKDNHSNSASVGVETAEGGVIPVIYVSECYGKRRCFVENILPDRSELVQVISAFENGRMLDFFDWVVDRENGFIYGIRSDHEMLDEKGTLKHEIIKYVLPKLSDGKKIVFEEKDIVDRFNFYFENLTQGAAIRGDYLYMPTGMSETDHPKLNSGRSLKIIDLVKKELIKSIDLTYVTVNEPEDIDFYGDMALLYCGQTGGLYEVNIDLD